MIDDHVCCRKPSTAFLQDISRRPRSHTIQQRCSNSHQCLPSKPCSAWRWQTSVPRCRPWGLHYEGSVASGEKGKVRSASQLEDAARTACPLCVWPEPSRVSEALLSRHVASCPPDSPQKGQFVTRDILFSWTEL
jgi:hypothetical protein